MVFLSGVSYKIGSGASKGYKSYVWKRFLRIIVPTWIFLFIYHITWNTLLIITNHHINMIDQLGKMFIDMSLMTSWYPWIMRLFFIVALLAPLVYPLISRLSKRYLALFVLAGIIINECIVSIMGRGLPASDWKMIIVMVFPYLMIFSIGSRVMEFTRKEISLWAFTFFCFFVLLLAYHYKQSGEYISLQSYKYPPQAYYISYGLCCTFLLWMFKGIIVKLLDKCKFLNFCVFIGQHTLWIYLWHILFVIIAKETIESPLCRFVFVYAGAVLFTFIHTQILKRLTNNMKPQKQMIYKLIFNG